jgi:signal transduction histidine kinase
VSAEATILIVDDDPVVLSLMRASLEDAGFDVIEAADGEEAWSICAAHTPDLMVVDVVMPRMGGFELCRKLRQHDQWASTPILMMTGLDDVPSIMEAYDAGATDFIAKPVQWLILNHRVRYMLRASHALKQLRENQGRLVAARIAAEQANRAKTQFLANMSHELRTPLNAIIGFSQVMQNRLYGPLAAKYADYARIIGESGTHLLKIINDILDITKAETNRLELDEEVVEISELVALSTSLIEEMAARGRVDYGVEVRGDVPAIYADAAKLRQVLINLLSNAIKFTPAGGRVRLTVAHEPDGHLAFRIEDTGRGIPRDKMALVLTPFGQVDGHLSREHGGVGLGLPLTKRLIELHGGTMEIASTPGSGTVVTARFPPSRLRHGLVGTRQAAPAGPGQA